MTHRIEADLNDDNPKVIAVGSEKWIQAALSGVLENTPTASNLRVWSVGPYAGGSQEELLLDLRLDGLKELA